MANKQLGKAVANDITSAAVYLAMVIGIFFFPFLSALVSPEKIAFAFDPIRLVLSFVGAFVLTAWNEAKGQLSGNPQAAEGKKQNWKMRVALGLLAGVGFSSTLSQLQTLLQSGGVH